MFYDGIIGGIRAWLGSMYDDYTLFINLFLEFPYCLTSKTGNAYSVSIFAVIFPQILVLVSGLIESLSVHFGYELKKIHFILILCTVSTIPVLRLSAMYAQPDMLGVVFVLIVIFLITDYRFEKIEPLRLFIILLSTICLIVTRRWYLYTLMGLYLSYVICFFIECYKKYKKNDKSYIKNIINAAIFSLISVVCILILFLPLIKKIMQYDYAQRYSVYNAGGLIHELFSQINWFNILCFFIILGIISLCRNKEYSIALQNILGLFIAVVLFTRVQNMGAHHVLLLIPFYLTLIITGMITILTNTTKQKIIIALTSCMVLYNLSIRFSTFQNLLFPFVIYQMNASTSQATEIAAVDYTDYSNLNNMFCLSQLLDDRKDINEIKKVYNWINDNCSKKEYVYFVPHDSIYNPDIIKNIALPKQEINNKICFGFDILGTQCFPTEIFDAKYIITADPFPLSIAANGRMSQRLNNLLLTYIDQKFKYVRSFDMQNGFTFIVYERILPVDRAEVDLYINEFGEDYLSFPDLFMDVLNKYMEENNIQ